MTPSDTSPRQDHTGLDRRGFLRLGMTGSLALASVSSLSVLSGCSSRPTASPDAPAPADETGFRFLNEEDRVLFAALIPAIVGPSLPDEPEERQQAIDAVILRVDDALYRFGPPNQAEFRQLLDLLHFTPTRLAVARVTSSWENVSADQAEAFLARWRNSRFGLLNAGYIGLIQVTNVAWYGHESHHAVSGYPGPPAFVYDVLPQLRS